MVKLFSFDYWAYLLDWSYTCVGQYCVARHARMIQFYTVLYGLMLTSDANLSVFGLRYVLLTIFLIVSIMYYNVITQYDDTVFIKANNVCAFMVGLVFSASVILRYIDFLGFSVTLNVFSGVDLINSFSSWFMFLCLFYLVFISLRIAN